MATTVVGLAGKAGCGKSVAAEVFTQKGYTPIKFAGPLKAMLRAFYKEVGASDDLIERKMEGDLKEQPCEYLGGKTPRYAMQTLGTEWGRDLIEPDLWTNAWKARVASEEGPVVTDDVRFHNEVSVLIQTGGIAFLVERENNDRSPGDHISEQSLPEDQIITKITNNSTEDHFKFVCDVAADAALNMSGWSK